MERLRKILTWVVIGTIVLYAGDYLSVRYGIPGGRPTFGTIQVHPYMAVPLKGGKEEIYPEEPQVQRCVQSLFPHLGEKPCWYVKRHLKERIDM
jgi:hypothetical protein